MSIKSLDGVGNPFRNLPSLDGVGNPFAGLPSLEPEETPLESSTNRLRIDHLNTAQRAIVHIGEIFKLFPQREDTLKLCNYHTTWTTRN
jgi:hypothetical protein